MIEVQSRGSQNCKCSTVIFCLIMWFQFIIIDIFFISIIIDIFHSCFIQNGTKDSISKLVSDLNNAKLEADVGKINIPYSNIYVPAGIFIKTSAIGFYQISPKSSIFFCTNLVRGKALMFSFGWRVVLWSGTLKF